MNQDESREDEENEDEELVDAEDDEEMMYDYDDVDVDGEPLCLPFHPKRRKKRL
jgi:hypothetical protein